MIFCPSLNPQIFVAWHRCTMSKMDKEEARVLRTHTCHHCDQRKDAAQKQRSIERSYVRTLSYLHLCVLNWAGTIDLVKARCFCTDCPYAVDKLAIHIFTRLLYPLGSLEINISTLFCSSNQAIPPVRTPRFPAFPLRKRAVLFEFNRTFSILSRMRSKHVPPAKKQSILTNESPVRKQIGFLTLELYTIRTAATHRRLDQI